MKFLIIHHTTHHFNQFNLLDLRYEKLQYDFCING